MDVFFIEVLKWLALGFIGIFIGMFIILSTPPSAETTVTPEKRRNFNPTFPLGREQKIRQLADRIRSGQSSIIIGLFDVEKTELLGYLRNEEPQQQEMLYGEQAGYLTFSYVDISELNRECTPAQLWERLLQPLQRHAELTDAYQVCQTHKFSRNSIDNLISELNRSGGRLVLLLDAFQEILKFRYLGEETEFFSTLRTIAASRAPSPLVVVAASSQSLDTFYSATKHLNPMGSPYLNFMEGGITLLDSLPESEVDRLLSQNSVPIPQSIRNQIKQLAGGHPYLLQIASSMELWKEGNEAESAEKFESVFFDRVKHILERMLTSSDSRSCQALLAVIAQQDVSGFEKELDYFEKQGIVAKDSNQWHLRAGIFRKIVENKPQHAWCQQPVKD